MLDFSDDFDAFDINQWDKGDHALGRSQLNPENVSVFKGNLEINLPARTLDGGEIRSTALYGYGSYAARMKVPHAPSSITGFFLYQPPDYASEIDIEIYNDSSRKMAFYSSYAGGTQTHTETDAASLRPDERFPRVSLRLLPDLATLPCRRATEERVERWPAKRRHEDLRQRLVSKLARRP